jgi:hypothetical protein
VVSVILRVVFLLTVGACGRVERCIGNLKERRNYMEYLGMDSRIMLKYSYILKKYGIKV